MIQLALSPEFGQFELICAYWAKHHPQYLAMLRSIAVEIVRRDGAVTVDELREDMERLSIPLPHSIGADDRMLGSVLRGCSALVTTGLRTTKRAEWAKRVGATRSAVAVYGLRAAG